MAAVSSSQLVPPLALQDFLQPLDIDIGKVIALSKRLCATYSALAAESENQFLPTPISYSILRPPAAAEGGRYGTFFCFLSSYASAYEGKRKRE
jgi:hypothetical protein